MICSMRLSPVPAAVAEPRWTAEQLVGQDAS